MTGSATGQVTAGNLASRLTGVLRVLAVAGAVGTTYLGNTYQTANLVSNLLFELLAAGILSSVLVPPFVRLVDGGHTADLEELAGALLGVALAVLGAVTLVGLLARTWIMEGLTVAVADPVVRQQEVRLGSFLLLMFLPQVLLYAVGAVATAALHATRRFAAAAFAPVANNVVVVAAMGLFWVLGGRHAGLDLSPELRLVLGVGTTAGVAAMTAVPLVALRRAGVRLRPRWRPELPALRRLGRHGAWGAAFLASGQVLVAVTLVLANRVEGGVVAYHLAFTAFLMPFAVMAHPVLTTLYPRLAAEAGAGRPGTVADLVGSGVRAVAVRTVPAAVALAVLGGPALGLLRLGALDDRGAALAAKALAAYAVGLTGYAAMQLLVRAFYAIGDSRTPAAVGLGVALGGSAVMVLGTAVGPGSAGARLVVLGLGHSAAVAAGALVLGRLLHRRLAPPRVPTTEAATA